MESTELTNRTIARYFHLLWEVWVILANSAALAVALTLFRTAKRGRETHLVVLSMSLCDLASGTITLAFQILSRADFGTLREWQCTVNGTLLIFIAVQSLLLVLVLGFVRYRILVQQPLKMSTVKWMVAGLWVTCVGYALFAVLADVIEPAVSRLYCFHRMGRFNVASTFLTAVSCLVIVAPSLVLLVCYMRAFKNVSRIENGTGKSEYSRRVAYMGFTIVLVYALSTLPFSACIVYRLIAAPENGLSPDVDAVSSIFVHINFGINPILYFVFQREYMNILRKWLNIRLLRVFTTISKNDTSLASGVFTVNVDKSSQGSIAHSSKLDSKLRSDDIDLSSAATRTKSLSGKVALGEIGLYSSASTELSTSARSIE